MLRFVQSETELRMVLDSMEKLLTQKFEFQINRSETRIMKSSRNESNHRLYIKIGSRE